jgi:hypothetical protein
VELPVDGMDSQPGAPVFSGRCWYGAWAEGRATQLCSGRDPETFGLKSADGTEDLSLRDNDGTVVANDSTHGLSWALQNGGALISNWKDFSDKATAVKKRNDDVDVPPTPEKTPRPPSAKDDDFGARPGRANVLPVLLNDSDRNGDSLLISSVHQPPATAGTVEIVDNGQKLQFTPRTDATGTVSFSYTINDGNGGEDTAQVSVRLVAPGTNHAPRQERNTRTTVSQGGHVSVEALDDWVDPESDPIYLESATADAPNQVGAEASGKLDLTQGGGEPGQDVVRVAVSDGKATGHGSVHVTVAAKGRTPIITENATLTGRIGTEMQTTPQDLARGGDGDLRLTRAEVSGKKKGLNASVVYADGSVKLVPQQAGDYKVTYAVSDGHDSATGVIRVVVAETPHAAKDPVVAPTTAFVRLKDSTDADVLDNAYDPQGGVLTITGVNRPAKGGGKGAALNAATDGVDTEITNGQGVKVTLLKQLDGPLNLNVTVSNGTSSAQGQLTLVQIPEPRTLQAPVARDDHATVRAGEVVDIPVLRNDSHPDGKSLRLDHSLVAEPKSGLMVVGSDQLRYLAPDEPGTYMARYRVLGPDGREGIGQVEVTVKSLDAAENRAPSAPTVSARARAGQPVTILIPVDGADPDGDSVSVSAVVSPPGNGTVRTVSSNQIVYVPNEVFSGTDTFTYRLTDALGASSVGTVRVGVQGRDAAIASPDASDDLVTTRPGSELNLDVLSNDQDPVGRGLTITSASVPSGQTRVSTDGKNIRMTAPTHADTVSVLYHVKDVRGATSSAWLTVEAQRNAPAAAPVTKDRSLSLSDVAGRKTVPVDVLSGTTLSEGSRDRLKVSLPSGWSDASVDAQGRVRVPVKAERSIIPFTVSRTDVKDASATAFITVPGTDQAPPEIRSNAPALKVASGEELKIDLSKQIIAAKGRSVGLADLHSVVAMNGTAKASNRSTVIFRSSRDYWGPAAVSVPVTDGRTRASVVLPITVEPSSDPAPVLRRSTVSVEAGESTTVDLTASTEVASQAADRFKGLRYAVTGANSSVASTDVTGASLKVTAAKGATPGSTTQARATVTDAQGRSSTAVVDITVISSTKPPPLARDDQVSLRRGRSQVVDVTANDQSPFKGRGLTLSRVHTATSVPGLSVARDGNGIRVSASTDARTGTATVVYTVEDATGDAARRAEGVLKVTVQDVPGAPGAPAVTQYPESAAVDLSAAGAEPNGSAITRYEYQLDDGRVGTCGAGPRACRVRNLEYGVDHVFRMRAVNGVGAGPWSAASKTVMMDHRPGTPRDVRLAPSRQDRSGHTLQASWKEPAASAWGSAVVGYTLKLTGPGLPDGGIAVTPKSTSQSINDARIRADQRYRISVKARNKRLTSQESTADATAVAAPKIVSAQSGLSEDGSKARVEFSADGRGADFQAHIGVAHSGDKAGSCSVSGFKPNVDGTTWESDLPKGTDARFTVQVSNGIFCTQTITSKVDTRVETPDGKTDRRWDKDGPDQGAQPYYHIDRGNSTARYFFVKIAKGTPSPNDGGWNPTDPGKDIDFDPGSDGKHVFVMNCRTDNRSFCSAVKDLGTQKKESVNLRAEAKVKDSNTCVAGGTDPSTIVLTKTDQSVDLSYGWTKDENKEPEKFTGADQNEEIKPDSAQSNEKVYLWLKTSKDGYTFEQRNVLTCTGAKDAATLTPSIPAPPVPEPTDTETAP